MTTKRHRAELPLIASFAGSLLACATTGDDYDSESHFACGVDADCPSGRCIKGVCEPVLQPDDPAAGTDTSDPRGTATPDCQAAPCTGILEGVYTARPPDGLMWAANLRTYPLLSVGADGALTLFFEELDEAYAGTTVVRRLDSSLNELSSTVLPQRESNAQLFIDDGGITIVESSYPNGEPGQLVVQTFDLEMTFLSERRLQIPTGTTLVQASSSGTLTLVGSSHFSGPDAPVHADCAEIDSLIEISAEDVITPLRCFRGITAGAFAATPSGFLIGGSVEGQSSEVHPIDLGDGPFDARGSSAILARYDRNFLSVWTSIFPQSDLQGGVPSAGGGAWATAAGGFAPGDLTTPLDPGFTRNDIVFVDEAGVPAFADAREGWTAAGPAVDGAGNAVFLVSEQTGPEGEPARFAEIRKIRRDGTLAWTVPIELGPMTGESVVVGPEGDVYFTAIIPAEPYLFPSATVIVGDQELVGPTLFVLKFAP